MILLLAFSLSPVLAKDMFKFQGTYKSHSTYDASRKDYFDVSYPDNTYIPLSTANSYDKAFMGSVNDLNFSLKGDLSTSQILDFNESLKYQYYKPEDYDSFALDNYKYTFLDHRLNVTYGLSLGKTDAIKLDYINSIYRIPMDPIQEYTSNQGKARFNHRINQDASLAFEGDFEEREYINDKASNYREAALVVDFSQFLPQNVRYRPVANSSRGDRATFEKIPTGVATQKAVDFYTRWTRPAKADPQEKFLPIVVRGDLYVNLIGDFRVRDRTTLDNSYSQQSGILKARYDASDKLKFQLDETYYQRDYKNESTYYYLFDHSSNRASLSGTYKPDKLFTYVVTGSNEFYDHSAQKQQDYQVNSLTWETYYFLNRNSVSLYLRGSFTRYDQPRLYFPNSDQLQGILGYDYLLTKNFIAHLKDEWIDYRYLDFEDLFYSSYVRNSWKLSFEKILTKTQALELGYQNKRETHDVYTSNNITEKTLFFAWNSNY